MSSPQITHQIWSVRTEAPHPMQLALEDEFLRGVSATWVACSRASEREESWPVWIGSRGEIGGETVFVEVDAAGIRDGRPFHEDHSVNIPKGILERHHTIWDLGPTSVRMPVPEFLVLMKIKALRARTWDLDHSAGSGIDLAYLRSKIWKDEHDFSGFWPHVADRDRIWRIAKKCLIEAPARSTLASLRLESD